MQFVKLPNVWIFNEFVTLPIAFNKFVTLRNALKFKQFVTLPNAWIFNEFVALPMHKYSTSLLPCQMLLLHIVVNSFTWETSVYTERSEDVNAKELPELLSSFDLVQHADEATHNHGGCLDLVVSCSDFAIFDVKVSELGFSDHCLATCRLPAIPPAAIAVQVKGRKWRSLNIEDFSTDAKSALWWSRLDGFHASRWSVWSLFIGADHFARQTRTTLHPAAPKTNSQAVVRPGRWSVINIGWKLNTVVLANRKTV